MVVCAVLTSCSPTAYYQIYQTKPVSDNVVVNEDFMVFEDDNCIVSYNFWKENGDFGFKIYNKNSENIYLHMDECFFVKNGYAYDYYDFEAEPKVICVPAKTAKTISEFNIASNIYHDCDLYLNPGKKDRNYLSFSEENTPLTFGNIIAYSVGESKSLVRFNNEFYISRVLNYQTKEITESVTVKECGKKVKGKHIVVKESGPDRFFNNYTLKSSAKVH